MLVHQRHLDRLLRRTNRLFELRSGEAIGQRIPSQVLDHLQAIEPVRFSRLDPAEHPRISKMNHLSIVEQQPGAAVRLVLSAGPMNEFAGHAQVSEEPAVPFEAQQEILPSPSGAHQLAANLPELLALEDGFKQIAAPLRSFERLLGIEGESLSFLWADPLFDFIPIDWS